ncbi:MAG: malto-oligosyltrehalose synthase [Candidatus Methylomirabilota bacterium]
MPDPLLAGLAEEAAAQPRIPLATYRLQFNGRFTFRDAAALVPYLASLGASDVYASSYLAARPGSLHGYDIADHNRLNPEVGGETDYRGFVEALRAHGMGHILDVVPNHMGIAAACNPWWNDVLENGPGSPFAPFFDIDWDPITRQLANKVLLPVLGDLYGNVLENQELCLECAEGLFTIRYHETRLPVALHTVPLILAHCLDALLAALGEGDPSLQEYQSILTALGNLPGRGERTPERVRERAREKDVIRRRLVRLLAESPPIREALAETLRAFNGRRGDPRSFDPLDRLLEEQVYRLAYWRVAAEEINYRRFFDINELAAIRMEDPAVFQETHRLILRLVDEGSVTGLRLDHPDGLFDPSRYFHALQRERAAQLLRRRLAAREDLGDTEREAGLQRALTGLEDSCAPDPRRPGCRPLYLLAEKILAQGERLPASWAVHGTTGYEFLGLLNGLFVDGRAEKAVTAAYAGFTGLRLAFDDLVYECKRLILRASMSSELNVLGDTLDRLSNRNRHSRDFTLNSLTDALREVIACFPVYRTYIDGRMAEAALQDRACVEVAVAFAKRRNPTTNIAIFDFVRDVLLLREPPGADEGYRADQRTFVQKFQQVTAPVTAKGIEDTAFYRYNRLVSLNEVGGHPDRFGVSPDEFHAGCLARLEKWPHGLSATSTHDTKRSEDVRARIHVLSEMPEAWRRAVFRWHRWNRRYLTEVDGRPAPDRNDEYLLYQTLVGAWPPGRAADAPPGDFVPRIQAYLQKAAREAKLHTSWVNPAGEYDAALGAFVAAVLRPAPGNRFLEDFVSFQAPVARLGMINSLAQTLVKIAAPGVPDFYQGTELWDFSLVDPDNRRPVDFGLRQRLLEDLMARIDAGALAPLARELLGRWEDGRIKLYLTHRALACRRRLSGLFSAGAYLPLEARGSAAERCVAFARHDPAGTVLIVVPRCVAALTDDGLRLPLGESAWQDTRLPLPRGLPVGPYRNLFTEARLAFRQGDDGAALPLADILADFPVALLEAAPDERSDAACQSPR